MFARSLVVRGSRSFVGRRLSEQAAVFDRGLKVLQRERALAAADAEEYDYLREAVAERVVGRLRDVARASLGDCLDVGCGTGHLRAALEDDAGPEGGDYAGGVSALTQTDCSEVLAAACGARDGAFPRSGLETRVVSCDEEAGLPFDDGSFDVVLSSLSLHWVNDVPRVLREIRRVLRPDGVFVGALMGAGTLGELQYSFAAAEEERTGGVGPHCSPAARVADCGQLLQGAGFKLITVDVERITVDFADAFVLLDDLQRMGDQHAPADGGAARVPRDAFLAMAAAYQAMFANADASVRASFEVVFLIGWAPHASQQQPDARGSATAKIGDLPPSSSSSWKPAPGGGFDEVPP